MRVKIGLTFTWLCFLQSPSSLKLSPLAARPLLKLHACTQTHCFRARISCTSKSTCLLYETSPLTCFFPRTSKLSEFTNQWSATSGADQLNDPAGAFAFLLIHVTGLEWINPRRELPTWGYTTALQPNPTDVKIPTNEIRSILSRCDIHRD